MSERLPVARALIVDFLRFARRRSVAAIGLVVLGSLLEGAGIIMLVPIVSLVLGTGETGGVGQEDGATANTVSAAFAWLGLETLEAQLGAALSIFAGILALRFAVLWARDALLARLQVDFITDLRTRAFGQLARAPWAEAAGMRQGPVGHALTRDVDRAASGIRATLQAAVAGVMLAVQFALALVLAPLVSLSAALLGFAMLRALRRYRTSAAERGRQLTRSDLAMFESVGGFLRGLKPAKAHGLENQYAAAFAQATRRVAEANRAFMLDTTVARLLLQTASGGIGIAAIVLGLFVVGTRPENLIVTLIILARLYTPLQAIQNAIQILRHSAEGYRAARMLAGPVGRVDPGGRAAAGPAPVEGLPAAPEIALAGVSVEVPAEAGAGGGAEVVEPRDDWRPEAAARRILDDVSATLPAGRVTALIGESGAGKSTLCDLAVGLLEPAAGQVLIDGAPLEGPRLARLRASLAYVGQEPFLFEDSLRNNLVWGCGPLSDDEIWQALATVGADGMARRLAGGLDGSIRAEGMRFSGGERQRLRLARALLRRPRFLVLDEATGALDLEAEATVLRAVLGARDGATVLMVSHRPSTLGLADRVIVLEHGRVREAGPVAGLAARPGSRVAAVLDAASETAPRATGPGRASDHAAGHVTGGRRK
ncbi:MAG TPA: ABC transporter ATP-binding protein [Thermohalobaculum sp.]|nr:ABC transporter ATP-binding protein [Thermohalobaculum sp.]